MTSISIIKTQYVDLDPNPVGTIMSWMDSSTIPIGWENLDLVDFEALKQRIKAQCHPEESEKLDVYLDGEKIPEYTEFLGLDAQLKKAAKESDFGYVGIDYGRMTGPEQIQSLPREKHKCHCTRDQVNWYGCKCGGI